MSDEYKKRLEKMLSGKKLILASNRGPYAFEYAENGDLLEKRGGGGLVSAFLSLAGHIDLTWFSVAKTEADKAIGQEGVEVGSRKRSLVKFVEVDSGIYHDYYNKMCNEVLWFIHHGLCDAAYQPVFSREINSAWNSYKQVNARFADSLSEQMALGEGDNLILFQDYHLYLAARNLQKTQKTWTVHFTHIPWPSPEIISIMPRHILTDILKGLLSHDLVGFHCQEYVVNFLRACEDILDITVDMDHQVVSFEGRWVPVGAFPISIDSNALVDESLCAEVKQNEIIDVDKRRFIFRADRVDPSKNIIRGFLAFERLLENSPEFLGKVDFLAYLYESRTDLKYYQDYVHTIKKTVGRINNRFGDNSWQPIRLRLADNYFQTLAAYKKFDVLLVNSIADGMNLVVKEGSLLNDNDGVVVLSARTGAHNELSRFCLTINPFDINETADSLSKALLMPKKERSQRSIFLKDIVKKNNSAKWLFYQLNMLEQKNTDFRCVQE